MDEHSFPSTQDGIDFVARRDGLYFAGNYLANVTVSREILRLAEREQVVADMLAAAEAELTAAHERGRKLREVLAHVTDRLERRLFWEPGDDEVIRAARELLKEE